MSDPSGSSTIPASWYPDPADARQLRYWDGSNWTNHTAPNPAAAAPPVAAPPQAVPPQAAPPQQVQPVQPIQHVQSAQPAEPAYADLFEQPADYTYRPIAFDAPDSSFPIQHESTPNTVMGWLYALTPVVLIALAVMPLPRDLLNSPDLALRAALVLLFVVLVIVLPAIDRLQLRHREFLGSPPAVLGVLPPVFSIARLIGVGRGGLPVAAVSLLVQAAVAGLLVLHFAPPATQAPVADAPVDELSSVGMVPPFTDAQKAALLTPVGMAAKIRFDAQGSALNYKSVECEQASSTDLGVEVLCTAVGSIADYDIHVQLLPTNDGVPFTVVSVVPSLKL